MLGNLLARLRIVLVTIAALAACLPVWSDVRIRTRATDSERVCYCDCEHMDQSQTCLQMCELPKYENRAWAVSCKKIENAPESHANEPGAHSRKNNHVQEARY